MQLAHFQSELVNHGLIVRGAIVEGEIHIGDDIIFGKGLVEAYHLESQIAVMPRIILSRNIVSICEKFKQDYPPNEDPYCESLIKDTDGYIFLNYLHNPYVDPPDYEEVFGHYLKSHKKIVESRLEKYSSSTRILEKYTWLGHYHNYFCNLHNLNHYISPNTLTRKFHTF